jgi:aspartyl-tRNA(Asn)/glutamyl-tRNA(Gln) amidotransferase subunit C
MAQFDAATLERLKKLCRIDCSPEEDADILQSLSRVLDYVSQLNEVDTEGVKTCRYVLRSMLKNQMRDDEVKDLLPRAEFLSNAPDQIGGMIRVPPVLKAP